MKQIVFLLLSLVSTQLFSQEKIITDRPDQTESSSTISKRSLQIEMGAISLTAKNNQLYHFAGPSTLLRYGITKDIEIRIFNQFESNKLEFAGGNIKTSGLSDLELGLKIQLFKTAAVNVEIAFLSHAIIPTAKEELSNGKFGTINKLSISHNLTNFMSLGYNIGYDYIAQTSALTYSVAIGFSFTDNFGGYIETFGAYAEQGLFEDSFDLGLTYLLRNNFQLDISYGLGINNDMQYYSGGFSWNIPNIFGSKK